jgi:hypothetical protein
VRFLLDVELDPGGIRGSVTPEGGRPVAFTGWLELVHVLEDRPEPDEAEERDR